LEAGKSRGTRAVPPWSKLLRGGKIKQPSGRGSGPPRGAPTPKKPIPVAGGKRAGKVGDGGWCAPRGPPGEGRRHQGGGNNPPRGAERVSGRGGQPPDQGTTSPSPEGDGGRGVNLRANVSPVKGPIQDFGGPTTGGGVWGPSRGGGGAGRRRCRGGGGGGERHWRGATGRGGRGGG